MSSTCMWVYLQLQLRLMICESRRWWLAPVIGMLSTTMVGPFLLSLGSRQGLALNAWDIVFGVQENRQQVFYLYLPLFAFLTAGLVEERAFDDPLRLRLGSRFAECMVKCLCVVIGALIYLLLSRGSLVLSAGMIAPFETGWSPFGLARQEVLGLPSNALAHSPLGVLLITNTLHGAGLVSLGLVVLVVGWWSRSANAGLAAGLTLSIIGFSGQSGWAPPAIAELLPGGSFFILSYPDVKSAMAYWGVAIVGLFTLSFLMVRQRDFLGSGHSGYGFEPLWHEVYFVGRIAWRNVCAIRRWWLLAIAGMVALGVGIQGGVTASSLATSSGTSSSLLAGMVYALSGPTSADASWHALTVWLTVHAGLLVWLGDAAHSDLRLRGANILSRVGRRLTWWLAQCLSLIVLACLYTLLILIAVATGVFLVVPQSVQPNTVLTPINGDLPLVIRSDELALMIAGLWATGLVVCVLTQNLLAVWSGRTSLALLLTVSIWLATLLAGGYWMEAIPWLPANQSVLVRHWPFEASHPRFNLNWTLTYNALLILLIVVIGGVFTRRLDVHNGGGEEA